MKGIRVDPQARTVRAQAGVLLGELDRETQAFGNAVLVRDRHAHRAFRLTLGGGINWLHRKYGLTIDQLLSVDLITAEGEFVKASETENPELFWGCGGGGGNFGIVTEFEFRLNPVGPTVLAGPIFWPIEEAPDVLRFYREWIAEAPDELMTIVTNRKATTFLRAPGAARQADRGRRVLLRGQGGGRGEGREASKEFGSPVLDVCVPKPFLAHQAMFDPSPGRWYYIRACTSRSSPTRSSTSPSITRCGSSPRLVL